MAIGLIAVVNAANAISLYLLAHELLNRHISNGRALILSGIAIWLTNVLIFALWYWQLDRRGPANRARRLDPHTQADSLGQFPTACVALITGGALRISRRDSAAPPC